MAKTWRPHLKLAFGGGLGNPTVEQWTCGIRFVENENSAPTRPQLVAAAAAVWTPLSAWMLRPESVIGNAAVLEWVKLNWILATGRQRDVETVLYENEGIRGARMTPVPWYQTQVLTFRTPVSRGRAHAGRIFPPVSGTSPATTLTPYCAEGDASVQASSGATMIEDVVSAMQAALTAAGYGDSATLFAAVVSPGDTAQGTTSIAQPISGVVVDRVADVQHRRTRQVERAEGTLAPVAFSA